MNVPDAPRDLGFDAKQFPGWRRFQKELIEATLDSEKPYILVNAPPGFGKSLYAATVAELSGGRTHYLVTTKSLQQQVSREFRHIFSMWGRNMHSCALDGHEHLTVDKAVCQLGYKCRIKATECGYYLAKSQAEAARVMVTNYQWYWYNNQYGEPLPEPDILICDEADTIESGIMSFASIEIFPHEVQVLGLPKPQVETMTGWLERAAQVIEARKTDLIGRHIKLFNRTEVDPDNEDSIGLARGVKDYEDLADRIQRMRNGWRDYAHLYVVDFNNEVYAIRPIVAAIDAAKLIHQRAPKKVFMSGTILGKEGFCKDLAIDPSQAEYIDIDSTFPADSRPLILHNVAALKAANIADWMDPIVEWVDGLIDAYDGRKGIVHTTNYRIAQHILRYSHNSDILIGHRPDNRMVAIKHFKHRAGSAVIVSPSLVRGEDFPGFHCEWQAIVKAPFPNMGDPQVRRRMEMDRSWMDRVALRNVIQAYGRGMRSTDDHCDTHAFDANIGNLFDRNKGLVPDYVWDAVATKERT